MARPRASVALRLTLWYAAAFAISTALAMALVYSSVVGILRAEVDAELRQDLDETVALVRSGGAEAFDDELARETAGPDSAVVFLRLWSGAGPVAATGFDAPDEVTMQAVRAQRREGAAPSLRTIHLGEDEPDVRVGYAAAGSGFVVEFGQSLDEMESLLGALRTAIFIALPSILLLAAPFGWFMARRAMRGVEVVTRTALEIADGAIDRRVPVGLRGAELDRLAQAFNRMLDRIEALMGGMREVTDNLAHDLRTPLSRIRAASERASMRATPAEWETLAGTTTEECDRMLQVLNSSLEIAEVQAGAAQLALEEVDLTLLTEEARELFASLAEDGGIALELQAPERCLVRADRGRVQRIVANLLDNALKFTPAGGRVSMSLADEGSWARLDVRDTGVGVSAEDLPRIFERFYRGDGSRTGRGSGLGLSLARAFARAHGGDITAASTPGVGSVFTLRLKRQDG